MGSDGMHPPVLRDLVNTVSRPNTITFERLWQSGEVPEDWKKTNFTPAFRRGKKKDLGNLATSQPHLNPWKSGGVPHSEVHPHMDDK